MSFQSALSGLNAASRNLDVIGNNIANANTIGMKSSRTEFADLVASSLGSGGGGGAGIGVSVATVSQQFSQGNINITGNDLDVAINGSGFFELSLADGSPAYTRDGSFKLDKNGGIITNSGAKVMGYPTDPLTGKTTSTTIQPLTLPTSAPIGANATKSITAEFNLDARAPLAVGVPAVVAASATATTPAIAASAAIAATPITTYGTSFTTFDSQGVKVPVSLYFVKVGPDPSAAPPVSTDTWNVFDSTTLAAGTAALAANAAVNADPLNAATRASNTLNFQLNTSNAAINTANATLDVKNAAINTANLARSAINDALNTSATPPSPLLPSLTDGTIALLPVIGTDGKLLDGSVDPMITADLLPTYGTAGTGVYADTVAYPIPTSTAYGAVASGATAQITFDVNGKMIKTMDSAGVATDVAATLDLALKSSNPAIGSFNATIDLSKVTQYGNAFSVSNLTQDGYASGDLVGLKIGKDGKITASYSNGLTQTNGQVALADFRNIQGLAPIGSGNWLKTFASGEPVEGSPGIGKFGSLSAGALEESNVDLTAELVNMMTAQRSYQANAQTIKTQDQIMTTLVNLR